MSPVRTRDTPWAVHAHELNAPVRVPARSVELEPLTADLRRRHVTIPDRLLKKIAKARAGPHPAIPATTWAR
jgi:hypothetical protein